MTIGPAPDWTEVTWLVGNFNGVPTLIAVDVDGNIVVPMMGMGPEGLEIVALDEGNRIIAVIRDPTSDNYIAIDGSGNITCIFKGMGPDGLITLKADVEGRLIAILTDPEDVWGVFRAMGFAELAARTGGVIPVDRRGDIIWSTSFEDGLQGSPFGVDHGDSKGYLESYQAFRGAFSVRLDPRSDADSYVEWRRLLSYPKAGRVGFEIALCLDDAPEYILIDLHDYDGTNYRDAVLRYEHSSGDWEIHTPGDTWTPILEGFVLQTGPNAWHPVKLVIDTSTQKYVRAIISRHVVDLDAYTIYEDTSGSIAQLEVIVKVEGSVAAHASIYFDNVIVTQNEPENPE